MTALGQAGVDNCALLPCLPRCGCMPDRAGRGLGAGAYPQEPMNSGFWSSMAPASQPAVAQELLSVPGVLMPGLNISLKAFQARGPTTIVSKQDRRPRHHCQQASYPCRCQARCTGACSCHRGWSMCPQGRCRRCHGRAASRSARGTVMHRRMRRPARRRLPVRIWRP